MGFLSAFGHFYNTFSERYNNLLMILCGSNASWIKEKIMKDSTGPMYQRVDKVIAMKPFNIKETKEYLLKEKKMIVDNKTIVDYYMVFGGVAKYLSLLDDRLSINDNINELFFKSDSYLYNEYNEMINSLFFDKSKRYKEILDILSSKKEGFTIKEIMDKVPDIKEFVLREIFEKLIDLNFIRGINLFNHKKRDTKYMIIDPLVLFYNKWLKGVSKNDLLNNEKLLNTESNSYKIWSGFAFEIVSLLNIELYLKKRGLSSGVKSIGYWSIDAQNEDEKGAQIDLLVEYNNHIYDIIECKYYNEEFTITRDYAQNLINKRNMFAKYAIKRKKYTILTNMITTYGTKRNEGYNRVNIGYDITLEDLL